jgi:hypothetical protein
MGQMSKEISECNGRNRHQRCRLQVDCSANAAAIDAWQQERLGSAIAHVIGMHDVQPQAHAEFKIAELRTQRLLESDRLNSVRPTVSGELYEAV